MACGGLPTPRGQASNSLGKPAMQPSARPRPRPRSPLRSFPRSARWLRAALPSADPRACARRHPRAPSLAPSHAPCGLVACERPPLAGWAAPEQAVAAAFAWGEGGPGGGGAAVGRGGRGSDNLSRPIRGRRGAPEIRSGGARRARRAGGHASSYAGHLCRRPWDRGHQGAGMGLSELRLRLTPPGAR
eukprot:scaffold2544_cov401-Prasinococcus_capsulatus_cf.AAC.8